MASSDAELSVLLTDNSEISELNSQFRSKATPTDVLSFPASEDFEKNKQGMLGDVVISLERAESQCADFGNTFPEEVHRLLVHGVLHLLGYDHENVSEEKAREMEALEEKYSLTSS